MTINKNKTADEMIEEAGFKLTEENDEWVEYEHTKGYCLNIWKNEKSYDCDLIYISLDIHLALHQKFKELGWLNEETN